MLTILKILIICGLIGIIYQDFKERKVFLWLLIAIICFLGILHIYASSLQPFLWSISMNIIIVFIIMLVLFLYSKFKLKQSLKYTFGLGDFLFFLAIAVGLPTLSFIVLFSFSLFFSLVVYLFLKSRLKHDTVPLAGLQALFFSLIFLLHWTSNFMNLYQY